ncbi:MAG: AAA family ATPase [Clostridia bacterium]|nr:AAA family ATPase [Clostridia bacterium]
MIISIEGMDGSGKTTVARRIEKEFSFMYVKDPLKYLFELSEEQLSKISRKVFDSKNNKLIALYLALGDCYALSEYQNMNVIMDRHVLLNYFWNGNMDTESIFKMQVDYFGKPDLTILLLASPQTRRKRISRRNPNDPDLKKQEIFKENYSKIIDFLEKYGYNYALVDTEQLSIEDMVLQCKRIIAGFMRERIKNGN